MSSGKKTIICDYKLYLQETVNLMPRRSKPEKIEGDFVFLNAYLPTTRCPRNPRPIKVQRINIFEKFN